MGCHHNARVHLETQVLSITRSEDLVKLRALAKLCSREFFNDPSLLVVAWDGYEEQLGRYSEKALEMSCRLITATRMSRDEKIEKFRDLLKRMERALGEENVVTLETLNTLGGNLQDKEEYEEAIKVEERCLAGRMKAVGEDHTDTLESLNNLGTIYRNLENYEKAIEYYERALKGKEKTLGKNHPNTPGTVMNIALVYDVLNDYEKAEELFERALEGWEVQVGKDHKDTKMCSEHFKICLEASGNCERLAELLQATPG